MRYSHATANDEQTFCGLSICGCGCFGAFRASLEDIECVDCLREMIRGLVEHRDYPDAYLCDTGYYKGVREPIG